MPVQQFFQRRMEKAIKEIGNISVVSGVDRFSTAGASSGCINCKYLVRYELARS